MKIGDIEIGHEYATRWYGQRVRAEEVAWREVGDYGGIPTWGARRNRNMRQVRVTHLNLITGKPLAEQPEKLWLPARDLDEAWETFHERNTWEAQQHQAQHAAVVRLREVLARRGFPSDVLGTSWSGFSVELSLTPAQANGLAVLLERDDA